MLETRTRKNSIEGDRLGKKGKCAVPNPSRKDEECQAMSFQPRSHSSTKLSFELLSSE